MKTFMSKSWVRAEVRLRMLQIAWHIDPWMHGPMVHASMDYPPNCKPLTNLKHQTIASTSECNLGRPSSRHSKVKHLDMCSIM